MLENLEITGWKKSTIHVFLGELYIWMHIKLTISWHWKEGKKATVARITSTRERKIGDRAVCWNLKVKESLINNIKPLKFLCVLALFGEVIGNGIGKWHQQICISESSF